MLSEIPPLLWTHHSSSHSLCPNRNAIWAFSPELTIPRTAIVADLNNSSLTSHLERPFDVQVSRGTSWLPAGESHTEGGVHHQHEWPCPSPERSHADPPPVPPFLQLPQLGRPFLSAPSSPRTAECLGFQPNPTRKGEQGRGTRQAPSPASVIPRQTLP